MKKIIENKELWFRGVGSDKYYFIQLYEDNGSYYVETRYGANGDNGTINYNYNGKDQPTARKEYEKTLHQKRRKAYVEDYNNWYNNREEVADAIHAYKNECDNKKLKSKLQITVVPNFVKKTSSL